MSTQNQQNEDRSRRLTEWSTFLFVTLVVLPGLAVAFVGSYGFIVWMLQLINVPPVAG
jgi:nitrate reductase NapE